MKTSNRFSIFAHLSRADRQAWMPSRGNILFTLVVVFAMAWAQSAHAMPWMSPSATATSTIAWPYQGRLADAGGAPLTGSYSMTFRLYNTAYGGTSLWEESWTGANNVQVSNGLFNVMLGSLNAIPQSLARENNTLWLGVTVGADFEMAPRIQLGSVPYAFRATQADRALGLSAPDGSPADALTVDNNGNIGIGTTSPGATFQVNGTVKMFGNWEFYSTIFFNTEFVAPSDGFVMASAACTSGGIVLMGEIGNVGQIVRGDSTSPEAPISITMPVRKGDTWRIRTQGCVNEFIGGFIYWLPLGN